MFLQKLVSRILQVVGLLVIFFGLSFFLVSSCTSPDAVYASVQYPVKTENEIHYEGTIFGSRESVRYPESVIQQSGHQYRLVSTELKEIPVKGNKTYVSAIISYELEGEQQPPETVMIDFFHDQTKEIYQRELSFLDAEEKSADWKDTFEFPIIVSEVDADTFILGTTEISHVENLVAYKRDILNLLGLSENYYHVKSIQWKDDTYEKDGIVFRNAIAKGEKLVRVVDARYGGQIQMPETIGYRYESIYEKIEEIQENHSLEADIESREEVEFTQNINNEKNDISERMKQFIREYLVVVTVHVMVFVIMLGCLGVMVYQYKKNRKEKSQD